MKFQHHVAVWIKFLFSRYALYRVSPQTEEQLDILADLDQHRDKYGVEFWLHGAREGDESDIIVEAGRQTNFEMLMEKYEIYYELQINDIQR